MKIYDKTVDCICNKDKRFESDKCKCYCHIPIFWRNLVWKFCNGDKIRFRDVNKTERELKKSLGS